MPPRLSAVRPSRHFKVFYPTSNCSFLQRLYREAFTLISPERCVLLWRRNRDYWRRRADQAWNNSCSTPCSANKHSRQEADEPINIRTICSSPNFALMCRGLLIGLSANVRFSLVRRAGDDYYAAISPPPAYYHPRSHNAYISLHTPLPNR